MEYSNQEHESFRAPQSAPPAGFLDRKPRAHESILQEMQALCEEKEELKYSLKYVKTHDKLTHLLNRDGIIQEIRLHQEKGIGGALLFLDIDNFKDRNTKLGHNGGDVVLQAVSLHLLKLFRKNFDMVARWGGEEFIVFFPDTPAEDIHAKIQGSLDAAHIPISVIYPMPEDGGDKPIDSVEMVLTMSGGITDLKPNEQLEQAVDRADKLMYKVKHSTKNNITLG